MTRRAGSDCPVWTTAAYLLDSDDLLTFSFGETFANIAFPGPLYARIQDAAGVTPWLFLSMWPFYRPAMYARLLQL